MTTSTGAEGAAVCVRRGIGTPNQIVARANSNTRSKVVRPPVMRRASCRVAAAQRASHTAAAIILHFARRRKQQNTEVKLLADLGGASSRSSRIIVFSYS